MEKQVISSTPANLLVVEKPKTRRKFNKPMMIGYLFLLPSLLILCVVGIYPLIQTLYLSFFDVSLTKQGSHFIGLENYKTLFSDIWFKVAYKNTWIFTAISVLMETLLGLVIALVLNKKFKGRGWVRACVLIPWAIPTVVSARMWEWIFNAEYGILNFLLVKTGIIDSNVNWLGETSTAMFAAIFSDVWKTTPFMALIILAGLQGISSSLYEAADIDGANKWRQFSYITFPLLIPSIMIAVLLRALDAFRVFDLIFVLTGGGPANSTEVLSSYAYKTTFSAGEVSSGAAMSSLMAVSVFVLAIVLLFLMNKASEKIEGGK
ncbi:carbohydrate ABC transporter membrane protein 1 (CUT1 family) [Neobacillus bataviensis]|uniref:Carbohydrate ABC transporter membrane protein 1 (CUT1 family) n=1 Tax=Neobacillus bataviensis TaxID=220685 RepID=A0A561DCU6_9BACI|nr:sugar ABC transporter permease [Neobacillus bataviensis]TWE01232.1 carbohydrate ABC transporter membrane protein 1 (CUT1 family) [Neobacillus bataviensis]